jgi:hypothetical protein
MRSKAALGKAAPLCKRARTAYRFGPEVRLSRRLSRALIGACRVSRVVWRCAERDCVHVF